MSIPTKHDLKNEAIKSNSINFLLSAKSEIHSMILDSRYFDKHGDYLTYLYNLIDDSNVTETINKARIISDQVKKENDSITEKQLRPFSVGLLISFSGLIIFGISNLIRYPSKISSIGETIGLGTILLGPIYMIISRFLLPDS